jgi:hypothetical protein
MNELRTPGRGLGVVLLLALGACGGTEAAGSATSPLGERPTTTDRPAVAEGPQATETNVTQLSELDDPPAGETPEVPETPELPAETLDRPVCPQCAAAGGETSDFGDERPRTPCELSAVPESIDVAAARALGFGAVLDALETSFDVPFEWQAGDPERPASGYAASTRVTGSASVASVVHQVPSLAGCSDWLDVALATTLVTADGALTIAGTLAAAVQRDTLVASVAGSLDLSDARGSLVIDPPPAAEPLVGFVRAQLYVWPDAVRLTLGVGTQIASEVGSDTPSYFYEPLFGLGPIDECFIDARPYAFDAATPTSGTGTFAARFAELESFIAARQPFAATWENGDQTTLSVELGEPLSVCDDGSRVYGSIPYRVESADGRVNVDTSGDLSIVFGAAAPGTGWVSASSSEAPIDADDFASEAGVNGVDFQGYGGGLWRSQLRFEPAEASVLSGELSVEAHDIDGSVSGYPGSYGGVVDTLRW